MEEKLKIVSAEEMKTQEKYYEKKMKEMQNEENHIREVLNEKHD